MSDPKRHPKTSPRTKKSHMTFKQEAILRDIEMANLKCRILTLGVAKLLNDDQSYNRLDLEASLSMLREAFTYREDADKFRKGLK